MIPETTEAEELVISGLQKASAATVVRINYRASPVYPYPTPFHDVLSGYDWILRNLLQDQFQRPYLARLGVCGELMGGSLATMLGLTECRLGESRISAVSLSNPIVDWVFHEDLPLVDPADLPEPVAPEETAFPADEDVMALTVPTPLKPVRKSTKKQQITSWQQYGDNPIIPTLTLSAERDVLFSRSEHCFDRFASPIHFFRSPYAQMVATQQDDMFASTQPDEPLDFETQMSLDHYDSVTHKPVEAPEPPVLTRCRAYTRNYPPAGTNLSLPKWTIMAGAESPLRDQARELTRALRRSTARHALKTYAGRSRWHDANEKTAYEEKAEKKVQFDECSPGMGLWTQHEGNEDWKKHVHDVGNWMKSTLSNDTKF
ncbi:hypothetical protein CC86DRAFT_41736 [Ophiobolus disseminans]|uniref:Alpha/beta hydrolase fold-3 domain-containing protein n=1 Tax=Ophiobolus disseminans TaxID=1469910 RepID=A0A6A6ZXM7_9PLEO|nr:hypothetical protein CC86DRAFT_41736 [Ophiobolus disseminans]